MSRLQTVEAILRVPCLQATYAIEYIGQQLAGGRLHGVRCIAASDVSASEAAFHGVPLTSLAEFPKVICAP